MTHYLYTDGPDEKPNGKHVVELVRPADIPDFFVCKLSNGQQVVVHRAKLKPVNAQQEQRAGGNAS